MTTFTDSFFRIANFCERVSVVQRRGGNETTFTVDEAASFRRDFSRSDADAPPRISIVWRLPSTAATQSVRRGDRILDAQSQCWIVVDATISAALDLVSCRCFCEQLFPSAAERVNIFRLASLNNTSTNAWNANATLVAANVPAVVRRRETTKERLPGLPTSRVVDAISLWIRADVALQTADVVVFPDGSKYETFAFQPANAISDWSRLSARKIFGDGGDWTVPG